MRDTTDKKKTHPKVYHWKQNTYTELEAGWETKEQKAIIYSLPKSNSVLLDKHP